MKLPSAVPVLVNHAGNAVVKMAAPDSFGVHHRRLAKNTGKADSVVTMGELTRTIALHFSAFL